jgi:hypothetical protein
MSDTPHLHYAILCDDVRREITGKEIIIGIYGDELTTPQFPVALFFTLYLKISFPKTGEFPMAFRVMGPSEQPLTAVVMTSIMAQREGRSTTVHIGGIALQVQIPGRIQFQWRLQEREWETIAKLDVVKGEARIPEGVIIGHATIAS